MAFRVEITPKASRDLDLILGWVLNQQAGETGLRWFQGLRDAISSLHQSPRRCALAPENQAFRFEVRQLLYGKKPHAYRVIFTVDDETVTVLRVRHGRRRPLTRM